MIEFNYDSFDAAEAVYDRANRMGIAHADKTAIVLDLLAANGVNGNAPLDYARLLSFRDGDFGHDFGGIRANLNRRTGQIVNCFLPRCAA